MKILLDGLSVLNLYKVDVAIFLVSALGLGLWVVRCLPFEQGSNNSIRLPAALGLGILVLTLPSFFVVLLGRLWHLLTVFGAFVILALAILAFIDSVRRREFSFRSIFIFCSLFLALVVMRLAFLKDMILPPYDDSPEHYAIVQGFLSSNNSTAFYSIENLLTHYYHFGFHGLAAWISSVSGVGPAEVIALLGQLFLAVFPFSIYLLAYAASGDWRAGSVSACFAAFAWRMPAYAANWGKYPAIMGLALFPCVIALWFFYFRHSPKSRLALGILFALTCGLVFVHSRLAICLFISLTSYFLISKIGLSRSLRYWEAMLLAAVACTGFLVFGNSLFVYYGNGYFIGLGIVALFLPFAFYAHPRFSFSITLFIWGVWFASRTPTFIESGGLTWLDQPFVVIMLCIPLSLLAGVGLSGLLDQLQGPGMKRVAMGGVIATLFVRFSTSNVLIPDSCCDYVKAGDLQAIQWIKQNSPVDAVVWIAGFKSRNYILGMDAGVWVQALTGRNVNKLPYDFAWDAINAVDRICKPNSRSIYVYEGGRPYSFDDAMLAEQLGLRTVFSAGGTKIYWAMECANRMAY